MSIYGYLYFIIPQLIAAAVIWLNGASWWWLCLSVPAVFLLCGVPLLWWLSDKFGG